MMNRQAFFVSLFCVLLMTALRPGSAQVSGFDRSGQPSQNAMLGLGIGAQSIGGTTGLVSGRHSLAATYGAAVSAGGNILSDALLGLDFLELLVNTGYLNAPLISPTVKAVGPIYSIPSFDLRADRFTLEYERRNPGPWQWGLAFQYQTIYAFVSIPHSFFDPTVLQLPALGFFPVTREEGGRTNLAAVYQLDARLHYYFRRGKTVEPFLAGALGVGSGWLGTDRAAWIQEAHLALEAGVRVSSESARAGSGTFWKAALVLQGFQSRTRGTNFFDRTKVLVNPGRGNIFILQVVLGAGVTL